MSRRNRAVVLTVLLAFVAASVFGQGVTAFGQKSGAAAAETISPELPSALDAAVRKSLGDEPNSSPGNLLFLMERSLRTPDAELTENIKSALADLASSDRHDKEGGGFVADKEKTVAANAAFLRLYSGAYRLYGEELYKEIALGIVDFLGKTDAGPAAPTATKALRAAALFEAAGSFGEASWGVDARREIIEVLSRNVKGNVVYRENVPGVEAAELTGGDLDSYVALIQASLAGYEYSGDLRLRLRAEQILGAAERRFRTDDGRLRTSADGEAQFHLGLNAGVAETALRLYYMLDKADYKALAQGVIGGFQKTYDQDLANAGAYGLAVDYYFVYPIKAIVIGAARSRGPMHAGVLALPMVNRVILPVDPGTDEEELRRLGYPDRGKPTVFLCTDKACSAPMSDASRMTLALTRLRTPR